MIEGDSMIEGIDSDELDEFAVKTSDFNEEEDSDKTSRCSI
jgi:hypothetical protein